MRPISLLNVDYKILSKVITNRLSKYMERIVPQEQKCGVKGRKLTDIIRNLANYRDGMEEGYFIMLDQTKAFDRVNHQYLFKVMDHTGVKGDFFAISKTIYNDISSQITVNGGRTEKIEIKRGVRQDCPYSMMLFVISTIPLILMINAEKKSQDTSQNATRPSKFSLTQTTTP